MQHVVRTLAAIRFALSTRRDLLLEMLALRHQLAVVTRSNRRFRPSDRLAWLILRRVWPRWRDALVLVQPVTVDRWYRDRCVRRWSRRPGRPRIDSPCRDFIGAWPRRIGCGAHRAFTAKCSSSASSSQKRLARRELARSAGKGSVSPTTLLHEAYLRMANRDGAVFPDRA